MALLAAGALLAIATLVDTVVTTWMTVRIARMNAAAVFISLSFWGWLWGSRRQASKSRMRQRTPRNSPGYAAPRVKGARNGPFSVR